MTTLANRIGRLEAVMTVQPDGEILTPIQQDELRARLATVREAMGEDLIPGPLRARVRAMATVVKRTASSMALCVLTPACRIV